MAVAAIASRSWGAAPSTAASRDIRFEVVTDFAGFDALETLWNALAERCGDSRIGFQSFAWLRSWLLNYSDTGLDPRLLLGYVEDRLALIWPLGEKRWFGLRVLHFLGEPMSQYHHVLVEPGTAGEALVEAALAHLRTLPHDLLRLRRVRDDSPLAAALRAAGAEIKRAEHAPYVDLAVADWGEASLSSKARQNRRRRLRRLKEIGEVADAIADTPELADAWIATALAYKRQWSINTGVYAPAVFDSRFERCFRGAARTRDPSAKLRVFALLCDGRPIGVDISFAYRGRLFGHVLAHDPTLAKFGVGAALADASIRRAREQGYQIYDLLAPADSYKAEWSHGEIGVADFELARTRAGAALSAVRARFEAGLRGVSRRTPLSTRRALIGWIGRGRLDSKLSPR